MLKILFQDELLVAVDKPSGMMVHRNQECQQGPFLVQELRTQLNQLVYPVHRLDRPTSGIILFALSPESVTEIQNLWHQNTKTYLTLVRGRTPDEFVSDRALTFLSKGGEKKLKECRTEFKTIKHYQDCSLVEAVIKTGRQHQIRRHLSHLGHHIIGDTTYGKGFINNKARASGLSRLFLHHHKLILSRPQSESALTLVSELSEELKDYLQNLN